MLTELRIANFAVIEQLHLEFSSGFQVLTGETGAGKSILVDALALLIGGRAANDQIRAESEEAELQASFSIPAKSPLIASLRDCGVLAPDETELIIRRILSRSGRNRVYLNGRLTPLHQVQSLAGTLIDIHGQHEQQSLLAAQTQLDALDAFGQLGEACQAYATRFEAWRVQQQALNEAVRLAAERQAKEDFIRFQHKELAEAELRSGEEEALESERRRLSHSQRLGQLSDEAYELLYGAESSSLGSLGAVAQRLKELAGIDPEAVEWTGLCESATVELRELAGRLRDYRQGLEHDPDRLAQIEERLDKLQRLKKKYGAAGAAATVAQLLAKLEQLQGELEGLDQSESHLADLREKVIGAERDAVASAERLSEGRKKAAKKLEARVKAELSALRMEQTQFQIAVASDRSEAALGPTGCDRVEFLLSANPGEPLQPMAKVASGGELSRIMLALKTVLAESDGVPVLIFDEVDQGVGGAVAAVMGKRLKALAAYHQVFCITHLPQIASQAGAHYVVEKTVTKKRTVTTARRLDQTGRKEEVARMMGGLAITKNVREAAAEMIGGAEDGD
ncbi:MAG: DNA repair protein RecN [Nitrospirae bacterium]|nr:MAG: DNA repair protein RecN [Nitrospirota bacterium]